MSNNDRACEVCHWWRPCRETLPRFKRADEVLGCEIEDPPTWAPSGSRCGDDDCRVVILTSVERPGLCMHGPLFSAAPVTGCDDLCAKWRSRIGDFVVTLS